MSEVVDFVTLRGEYVSLFLVAGALGLSGRQVTRLFQLPAGEVGDLFWNAGVAFVVVARLGFLVTESPSSLTDPLVLIRLQGGLQPFLGVLGAIAMVLWRTRGERGLSEVRLAWFAVLAVGLVITTVTYDVACVVRDACYGAEAPAPLGFAMSGLSDTRLATPLIEATLLLIAAGGFLSLKRPLAPSLLALGGTAALLRVALTPASVRGVEAVGIEATAFFVLGIELLLVAVWAGRGARAITSELVPNDE